MNVRAYALAVGLGLLVSGSAAAQPAPKPLGDAGKQSARKVPFYQRAVAKLRDGYELRSGFGPIELQLALCRRALEPLTCAKPIFAYALEQWTTCVAAEPFCPESGWNPRAHPGDAKRHAWSIWPRQ